MLSEISCVDAVYPSGANFLLVALNKPVCAATLTNILLSRYNIYVKDISHKFGDGRSYIRLAVRLPEENAAFVRYLKESIVLSA